jgi:hypothetical protein
VFDKLSENNIDDLRDSLFMHTDQTVIHYAEYLFNRNQINLETNFRIQKTSYDNSRVSRVNLL